jgi:hypothetical protein
MALKDHVTPRPLSPAVALRHEGACYIGGTFEVNFQSEQSGA